MTRAQKRISSHDACENHTAAVVMSTTTYGAGWLSTSSPAYSSIMAGKDKRSQRYMDELDRRSPVNLSDATRARDVSRPDASALDEALHRIANRQEAEAAGRRPRTR